MQPLAMLAFGAGLLAPSLAFAVEGVIVIHPERASRAAPEFPLIIAQPGSYRLAGNLIVPDVHTTAIEIDADDVTIDLNGFSIVGPARCSPPPVSCVPAGGGNGVHTVNRDRIVVRNGNIQGVGNVGVYLETNSARIDRLSLVGNGGGGAVLFGGLISDSVSELNGGAGIAGLDITVRGSLSRDNALFGLEAYRRSSYENSRFSGNNNNGAQVNNKPAQAGGNLCNATACP
ncbi:MAG: right-handed parallel beta-helix repeat-containing protein [Noviherbaspirillum sp.]